jgi:hypothetical protein
MKRPPASGPLNSLKTYTGSGGLLPLPAPVEQAQPPSPLAKKGRAPGIGICCDTVIEVKSARKFEPPNVSVICESKSNVTIIRAADVKSPRLKLVGTSRSRRRIVAFAEMLTPLWAPSDNVDRPHGHNDLAPLVEHLDKRGH